MDFYPIMTYSYGTLTTNTYNITDTGSTTLISSVSKNLNIYGPKKQQNFLMEYIQLKSQLLYQTINIILCLTGGLNE